MASKQLPVDKMMGETLPKHFVASAYIVRDDRVLLVHHRKIQLWLPPGGHVEEFEDPVTAVHREVKEETGLEVSLFSAEDYREGSNDTVRVLPLPHHLQVERIAEGPHHHIDLVYFCKALPGDAVKNAESTDLRWFSRADLTDPTLDSNVRYFATLALDTLSKNGATLRSAHP